MLSRLAAVFGLMLVAACSTPQSSTDFNDPYETQNRAVHESNKKVDKVLVRPVALAYGEVVPGPVRGGITNFTNNLALPGMVLNDLMQLRIEDALFNSTRFLFNSTIGIAGILDPSSAIGLTERSTDFGETLHVWGVGEGRYLELPVLGPSTERDAVGNVVDIFLLNPTGPYFTSPTREIVTGAKVTATLGKRYTYKDTIDSVLYDSADSYAQARLLYLQSRRFELGGSDETPDYYDPYADPYEDPYAQ